MILFYCADISTQNATIEADEFTHCIKVLRHKIGDEIHLADGKGLKAKGLITSIHKSSAQIEITEHFEAEKNDSQIHLAIAPPKNRSRWELLLEKCVEIGVDKIIPIKTSNSERVKLNLERGQKIVRSAALQSTRDFHPSLVDIVSYQDLLKSYDETWLKFIAHYKKGNLHLAAVEFELKRRLILVGPEGDFTNAEIEAAVDGSFTMVNISENRLRTETAGIVGVNFLVD